MIYDLNTAIMDTARRIAKESGDMLLLPYFLDAVTSGAIIERDYLAQDILNRREYEIEEEVTAES